jgi:ANTAR domain
VSPPSRALAGQFALFRPRVAYPSWLRPRPVHATLVGLLGLSASRATAYLPVDWVRQFGDRAERHGHADRPFDAGQGHLHPPVELGGGPIGSLDLYATSPRAWDDTEVSALQAYAGVMASLLGAAAKAEVKGALADQLQVALDSRVLIERAKGALMERERLDEQEAFTHLRRAARSSGRKLNDVAREVAAGAPLPRRPTRARQTPGG